MSGDSTLGIAWRINKGFFCQYRRMNCDGVRLPSNGVGVSREGGRNAVAGFLADDELRAEAASAGWSVGRLGIV
ncbi:hypothetical protein [Paraburkholderia kirstenboschensis]|uniref:Uncharacterized protein n=1 Tax=Paraburkholderia kirstenboschensis TaxID=1245436 RepID=A0ABZ0EW88_9BURK|nr:hypothetical protein [Paraburkholderia kirstenboschensis]WOD20897.1 hypothetical protein RW095_25555 [Paraburkholderia kirstenboschensis]